VRRNLLFLGLLVALCANARADELFAGWDKTDRVLLGTALGSIALDWGQTRDIAKHPERFVEHNPILGAHPSVGAVDRYFIVSMAGTVGVAAVLPATYRKWFLGGVTVLETAIVIDNRHLGLRVRF
jgi:hypothetical protein